MHYLLMDRRRQDFTENAWLRPAIISEIRCTLQRVFFHQLVPIFYPIKVHFIFKSAFSKQQSQLQFTQKRPLVFCFKFQPHFDLIHGYKLRTAILYIMATLKQYRTEPQLCILQMLLYCAIHFFKGVSCFYFTCQFLKIIHKTK